MNCPLVSVIIPAYNRVHLIGETLDSIIAQTYQNWECIIVDDGSTDETIELCREFHNKDSRISIISRSSIHLPGGNGARNEGLNNSNGDWVMFLDSDDLLTENCLRQRVTQLNSNQSSDMLLFLTGTFYFEIGDSDIVWNHFNINQESIENLILRFIEQDMPWSTNGVLWKKKFLLKIGGWNEELKAWQDWELNLRALNNNPKLSLSEKTPDNFYRLNVKGSIASQFNEDLYFYQIKRALLLVEPIIISINNQVILSRYKYLIIRNLIRKPIMLNNYGLLFKLLFDNINFRCLSKGEIFRIVSLELVNKKFSIVSHIYNKLNFKYFEDIQAKTTHLQSIKKSAKSNHPNLYNTK